MDLAALAVSAFALASGVGSLVKATVTDTPAKAAALAKASLDTFEARLLEKVAERLRNAIEIHEQTCRVRPGSSSSAFAALNYASKHDVDALRSEMSSLHQQITNMWGDVRTAEKDVARLVGLLEGEARAEERHSKHGQEDD